jgi:Zn-finger nucleic acid-binding protein
MSIKCNQGIHKGCCNPASYFALDKNSRNNIMFLICKDCEKIWLDQGGDAFLDDYIYFPTYEDLR